MVFFHIFIQRITKCSTLEQDMTKKGSESKTRATEVISVIIQTYIVEPRYIRCEPQSFQVADIVQAQLSFVVVPMKGRLCKMLTVLRSITLIDDSFGTVCLRY